MVYARQLVQYAPFGTKLATMPWIGSKAASAVSGSGTRSYTTVKRKRKRAGKTSIRALMLSTLPSKQMTAQLSATFTHSTLLTVNLTSMIIQGNSNQTRVGDSIQLLALKINGALFTAAAAGAYTYRIIIGYSGEEYNNTTLASGLGISEVYLPNTATNYSSLGIINPRAFTVLHDFKVDINSLIAATVDLASFSKTVSLNNAKFDYQSAGSNLGKVKNLYMLVMGDVAGGILGTTAAGTTIISVDTIFK